MNRTLDQAYHAAIDHFHTAATGDSWRPALEQLAHVTGSRSAQIMAFGRDYVIPFNVAANLSDASMRDFLACNGNDPKVNPRLNRALQTKLPEVATESDFLTPEEHAKHPYFNGYAARWDIPFSCFTTLEHRDGMLIGLAVLRSKAQGHIGTRERQVFAAIAPHARTAVRTRLLLEEQGAKIAAGLFDAVSLAVFVCDHDGMVRAMTAAAESLVSNGTALQMSGKRLSLATPAEGLTLQDAIASIAKPVRVASSGHGAARHKSLVILPAQERTNPLLLDIVPFINPHHAFNFDPSVLVIASANRPSNQRRSVVLRSAYGLTDAEVKVALQLLHGCNAETIAAQRGVVIGTIRAQIKSILAKVGVSRQIELLARLTDI
jgi:DNA-binding CsgD family transcriptional regulator